MLCLSGFELCSSWVPLLYAECSRYTGQLSHQHENHTEWSVCSHIRTVDFGAISVTGRSCDAPISKVRRHISDRFGATLRCTVNWFSDSSGGE